MSNCKNHTPQWELVENGWQAVVTLCNQDSQWTAYIQFAEAPFWRKWAGCMFRSLEEAQEWCKQEIVHQHRASVLPKHGPSKANTPQPITAWAWLWEKLNEQLGSNQATEIRSEMDRRLKNDHLSQRAVGG